MTPEYEEWARMLLEEIYYAADEGHRTAILKEHLLKANRRGYIDGTLNSWWKEQEKNNAK